MYNISYTKLEITKSHAMASGIKDVITVSAEERLIRRSDLSDEFSKIFWISSSRDLYAGATYRAENTVYQNDNDCTTYTYQVRVHSRPKKNYKNVKNKMLRMSNICDNEATIT